MTWYLRQVRDFHAALFHVGAVLKGSQSESVANKDPVKYYFQKFLQSRDDMTNYLRIFVSDAETPPCRIDKSVKELCLIKYDVGQPWDELEEISDSDGTTFRCARGLRLMMAFDGEPKWTLKAGFNTVEQSVNVEYKAAA